MNNRSYDQTDSEAALNARAENARSEDGGTAAANNNSSETGFREAESVETENVGPAESGRRSYEEQELQLGDGEFPLERYKPLVVLGIGTVGTVYLCRDRLLQKRVAVKVLKALTGEQLVAFQQEARATSRLSHRNIVKVLDFGATACGVPFMVMEYVEGVGLDRVVREQGPLEPVRALPILMKVCDALEYAHGRGTFHRDVKSANVLVVDNGVKNPGVRLIDFGVASIKLSREDAISVQGCTIVGTPQYMSPDQCHGLPYDESSEIYSFGCVLFEALTGRPPFKGDTALETIAMHANEPPPTLSQAYAEREFDPTLESVVARCLAKKPEERYPSMEVLKADLVHCLSMAQTTESQTALRAGRATGAEGAEGQQFPFLEKTTDSQPSTHDRDPILTGIMIGLLCFSAASWIAYSQIERILSNKKTTTSFQSAKSDHPLPVIEDYAVQRGFIRSYTNGRLEIQAKTPVSDEDLRELAGDSELVCLSLLAPVFSGRGFDYLASSKLSEVILIEGTMNDVVLEHLAGLKNLGKLELLACRGFTIKGIESLKKVPLARLAITNTNVGDPELKAISEIPTLSILDYSSNYPLTPDSIRKLGQRTRLEELTISSEQLDSDGYDAISGITSLRAVTFAGKQKLAQQNFLKLTKLPSLHRIGLTGGATSDEALMTLGQFDHLRALELKGSNVRDQQIRKLRGLKLRGLTLLETAVTDKGLSLLAGIPDLQVLRLQGCPAISSHAVSELSRRLPNCQQFRNLCQKTGLDLVLAYL